MSDIIKLLPDSVANQIAAGEVIQRPASVIKELVENAVDAGATEIRVFIKDAGRTLIQVTDNGKGMSETDARMAFERHATSKIRGAEDLFSLHTMGFRGEALPSICAISQVEMKTKTAGSPMGTKLEIRASSVESQEPCICDDGTNIMVKNIFFNVPARRKFLKSDNVELSNIMREFERLALVNNHIRMSIDTGARNLELRAGSFKQRIGEIWKNNLDLHLLPIEVETSLIKISGFISRPEFARRRNPLQYLIVNGRNMCHPYFHKAIMNCYDSLIASDTQPCYFLKFEVDPGSIDVNIHPTKKEIKFEYEQEIWPILQASVKAALGKHGAVPAIDFNSDILPAEAISPGETPKSPSLDISPDYNPFTTHGFLSNTASRGNHSSVNCGGANGNAIPRNWDSLYNDFLRGAREFPASRQFESSDSKDIPADETENGTEHLQSDDSIFGKGNEPETTPICVQHGMRYILTSTRDGIVIVNQHRAHVRILYDKFLKMVERGERVAQPMMFPDVVRLDPEQQLAFQDAGKELDKLGFILEYDEGECWKIKAIPVMIKDADPKDLVLRILDSISDSSKNYGNEASPSRAMLSDIALEMARSMAMKGDRKLTADEMEHLVGELFSLSTPAYTPNGNPVYRIIGNKDLEAMF